MIYWGRRGVAFMGCCALLLMLLGGCGTSAQGGSPNISVTSADVESVTMLFDGQSSTKRAEGEVAQKLYKLINELPPYPEGKDCEEFRLGDWMTLKFYQQEKVILEARAEKNGCHGVVLPGDAIRRPNQTFWDLVQQVEDEGKIE